MSRYLTPELDAPPLYRWGLPDTNVAASPAAGADFEVSPDGKEYTRLIVVCCRLVTDANVANREVTLEVRDSESNRVVMSGAAVVVVASTTQDYVFSSFVDSAEFPCDSSIIVPLSPLLLLPTWKWRLHVVNIQATDQLSRIRVTRERFLTGAPA